DAGANLATRRRVLVGDLREVDPAEVDVRRLERKQATSATTVGTATAVGRTRAGPDRGDRGHETSDGTKLHLALHAVNNAQETRSFPVGRATIPWARRVHKLEVTRCARDLCHVSIGAKDLARAHATVEELRLANGHARLAGVGSRLGFGRRVRRGRLRA